MQSLIHTRGVLAALVLLVAPSMAFAQAAISGVVRDTSGAVLPGVTVEARSPVLIEQVRTAVSDGNGRFQIVNLRPGEYTVTFTLPGFSTVERTGVTLSGSATVQVDAEMAIGGLEETITVTGDAAIVDVTSTTRQSVLSAETIDALPTSRSYGDLARMIPGTSGGGDSVGGATIQGVGASVTVHGSRNTDQRVTLNGVPTMTLQAGGNIGGQIPDVGSAAEVTVEHTAVSAELPTGGVRINFVPRDGGNTFSGSTFFTFANGAMQGSNFTEELRQAGLTTPNEVKKNWDLNAAFGGPFAQDKVWYWASFRRNIAEEYVPIFWNANAFDPNAFLYEPDTTRRGEQNGHVLQSSVRVTWQASPRNKIAGTYKQDRWCLCPELNGALESPEAGEDWRFPVLSQKHLEWTSPVTNRLLLDAVGMHLYERWGRMHPHQTGWAHSFSDIPEALEFGPQLISVQEQSSGLTYRANPTFNNTTVPNYAWRAAATYVTGTHNFKVGVNGIHGYLDEVNYALNPMSYRFRDGVPNRITLRAYPIREVNHMDMDFGIYAQDTITLDRITVGGAVRFDTLRTSSPEQQLGPGRFVPDRNLSFPAQDHLQYNDITYRSSFAYDLRGDGRTALKATANRYLLGQTLNGLGSATNPVNTLVNETNINWTDTDGDFEPDCDLLNPLPNGECQGWSNRNFGSAVPAARYADELLTGFGNRMANWEFSAGVQHELVPRISLDVAWFRRVWSNFEVVDDLALGPDDFDTFSMTVPEHPELPGGGGYVLEGLRALRPEAFGRPSDDLHTLASNYGEQTEHWNGMDVALNGRMENGLTFQVGTSTGRTTVDDCEIAQQIPEANLSRPLQFCRSQEPWLTSLKGFAVYTLPGIEVQLSGTFRSTPGAAVNASFVADNAYLAANSTLGRPLAGGANANIEIDLLEPDSKFIDRRNELDIRVGKVLRFGEARSVVSFDVYNLLNTDAVLDANENFGQWLAPTEILNARMAKVSVTLDF